MTINRAAIYARFSTDLQRDRSIDDQVALCRDYAVRAGYQVVKAFSDRAVSGANRHRHGLAELLESAKAGQFDFVIAESLSRIARDQEDSHAIRKRLEFAGVKIVTVADGVVSPLLHGLRTVIDSQYIADLKVAIHRGMTGVVRDGRHAGGRAYGYRPAPGLAGDRGRLEIVQAEAEIVWRIFREYAEGRSPREIAGRLNAEGVPPPRKGVWRASSIHGHLKRKTGILQNELYRGRLVWNRTVFVRDPDTRRRLSRVRPEGEWQYSQAEHLRIVPDGLFEAVQQRRAGRAYAPARWRTARPKRILSGLLRCGACDGGMSRQDTGAKRPRVACTRCRDAKACDHRRSYHLDDIERGGIGGLQNHLGTPAAISYFVECYNAERARKAATAGDRRAELAAELAEIDRRIDRAVAAIIDGRITEQEVTLRLPALRERRAALAGELSSLGNASVVKLHLPAVKIYLRDLRQLERVINSDLERGIDPAANTIRAMIETVRIVPAVAPELPEIIVRGDLAAVLSDGHNGKGPQSIGGGFSGPPLPIPSKA
jgi:site-specific DNA recombinase